MTTRPGMKEYRNATDAAWDIYYTVMQALRSPERLSTEMLGHFLAIHEAAVLVLTAFEARDLAARDDEAVDAAERQRMDLLFTLHAATTESLHAVERLRTRD